MSKFRETPCKNYICNSECKIGRKAEYSGYCQHCDKYIPRAKLHFINKKRERIEKINTEEAFREATY